MPTALDALSPLDGRYRPLVDDLAERCSEKALLRARVHVEVEWLVEQAATDGLDGIALDGAQVEQLRSIAAGFGTAEAKRVKALERTTQHDVKAVEYFLAEQLKRRGLAALRPWVHFGCTSEDINNLAHGAILRDALDSSWKPAAAGLVSAVAAMAHQLRGDPLLSRTHGQPATPTTLGKELAVFVARWEGQLERLARVRPLGKFNGAVGTFSAHVVAYPDIEWPEVSRRFVERLGFAWNPLTTQIEPHDYVAETLHAVAGFNAVLLDFAADMWAYIGAGVLRERPAGDQVGSSTMPHKVNPIRFENAEANAGISTAILEHLGRKLPISRLQRDLSDSSALRNVGVALGHSLVAIRSVTRGLEHVAVDRDVLREQLDGSWEVLTEAVQTVLRKHGDDNAYERLRALAAEGAVDRDRLHRFIADLDLSMAERSRLTALTPASYTGAAADLVERYLPQPTGQ